MIASLQAKTALVTGAGRGIGQAIALELASAGLAVALVARSEDQLADTAEQVKELGATAVVVPADLADLGQVTQAALLVADQLGTVDVLINDAATLGPLGPSVAISPAEWAATFSLNVVAAAVLSFAVLPAMVERGWGRIVNVSSAIAGQPGAMVGMNAYAASKAALEAHTVNLAAELAHSGVTVNAFRPGSVDTAMQAGIRAQDPARIGTDLHEWFARSYSEGNMITPQQSARSLVPRLSVDTTGQIWEASSPTLRNP
jgi:NAD(P)-dependent dehydrogenase (short-subunit alcohol dehydrogenase family)